MAICPLCPVICSLNYACLLACCALSKKVKAGWPSCWPTCPLVGLYISVIRPVFEYYAIVWHHGLSNNQTESIEAIQRRVLRIVYPITASMPYWAALHYFTMLTFRLFPIDVTNYVMISFRNCAICCHQPMTDLTSRLRRASIYPRPRNRTNCYKSFIHHALLKYQ